AALDLTGDRNLQPGISQPSHHIGPSHFFFIQTFNLNFSPRVIRRNMALLTSAAHCFRVRAFFLSQ
ncbi:MAG: hypothetical protein ACWA7E_14105, partial [Pseudomonas asiatica]